MNKEPLVVERDAVTCQRHGASTGGAIWNKHQIMLRLVDKKLRRFGDNPSQQAIKECIVSALMERALAGVKFNKEEIHALKMFFGFNART